MSIAVLFLLALGMLFFKPLRYALGGMGIVGLPYLLSNYLGYDFPPQAIFLGAIGGLMIGIGTELPSFIPGKKE
jgi:hypothetical protein